jgi:hypothetical protein
MKQLKVSVPDDLLVVLEKGAAAMQHSVSAELRRLIELGLAEARRNPKTGEAMMAVAQLADLVELQTGRAWYEHPAAASALCHAIQARLARMTWPGEATFGPDELPAERLVGATDPREMGTALEAIDWFKSPKIEELRHQLLERRKKEGERS